ncbi:hypothetical protein WJX73_000739 [Symbiochloris irregularis]|uniref:DNA-directed RNA polymerase III subunit RPC4 n=1 Tax=Symbiochloris irregularis TaxID=706552 RepID=A0AAW1NXI2_9CHLO
MADGDAPRTKRIVTGRQRLGSLKEEDPSLRSGSAASASAQRPATNGAPSWASSNPALRAAGSAPAPSGQPSSSKPPTAQRFKPRAPARKSQPRDAPVEKTGNGLPDLAELQAAARLQAERSAERQRAYALHQQRGGARMDGKGVSFGSVSTLGPSAPGKQPGAGMSNRGPGGGGSGSAPGGAGSQAQMSRQMQDAQAAVKRELADIDSYGGAGGAMDMDMDAEPGKQGPPFDYTSFYPTMLPFRPPGAETMEDEGVATESAALELQAQAMFDQEEEDGGAGPGAAEGLGLWPDAGGKHRLMLVQLPDVLPQLHQPQQQGKGSNAHTRSRPAASGLRDLGDGRVGKLLVFESGAVKLQLGDVLLDVSAASLGQCRQEVAMVNAQQNSFTVLGAVTHSAVCTPDLEQLLSNEPVPNWPRADTAHSAPDASDQQQIKLEPAVEMDGLCHASAVKPEQKAMDDDKAGSER